jgi:antirestriction protein ArdC
MPNHVASRILVTGPTGDIASFRNLMIKPAEDPDEPDALVFDFNGIVPMPAILRETENSSDVTMGAFALGLALKHPFPRTTGYLAYPWVRELGIETREAFLEWVKANRPEALEKARAAQRCQTETGFPDWYGWSLHHWGTKWNAYDFALLRDDPDALEFRFSTAWSFPAPVLCALEERFPDLRFSIAALDEGWNFALRGVLGARLPDDPLFEEVEPSDELDDLTFGATPPPPARDRSTGRPDRTEGRGLPRLGSGAARARAPCARACGAPLPRPHRRGAREVFQRGAPTMPKTVQHRRPTPDSRPAPRDHYAEVTASIVAALESGTRPWRRTWRTDHAAGPRAPVNGATGRRYRGVNLLLLLIRGLAHGSPDPRWMTYRQAQERGWQVRRGERATTVFFFKRLAVADDRDTQPAPDPIEPGRRFVPLLRAFSVFHASQVDGVPPLAPPGPSDAETLAWSPPEAIEVIAANSGVPIHHGGDQACYIPARDTILLPPPAAFESPAAYAATKAHELAHASGAKHRLNRDLTARFGTDGYAREELRAEIASAMLGAELGLDTDLPNHADYLAHWLEVLKADKREIFRAAADAGRIADWMLALHPEHAARLAAERADDGTGDDTEDRPNTTHLAEPDPQLAA